MNNKYNMSVDNNVILANRLLIDSIYESANLEGIAITFANTMDIVNRGLSVNLNTQDVGKVVDLKRTWEFLLGNLNAPIHLGFLEELHQNIAKSELPYAYLGKIRTEDVLISGTSWRPELPNVNKLHEELMDLLNIECCTERAIRVLLWIMRSQIFQDGNKRVASFVCNRILIAEGCGLFSVPVELDTEFKLRLVLYYESNNLSEFMQWIWDNCLKGVNELKYANQFQ